MSDQEINPLPWQQIAAEDATTLVVIRHARSTSNDNGRLSGREDVPLNDVGHHQARKLARRLTNIPFQSAFTSHLRRAIQTAAPILNDRHLSPRIDERLSELDHGELEGLHGSELPKRYPEILKAWRIDPSDVQLPGGETLRQGQTRFLDALHDISAQSTPGGPPVLIVAHKLVISAALCAIVGLELKQINLIGQANTAVNLIRYQHGRLTLHHLNDIEHVRDDPPEVPVS